MSLLIYELSTLKQLIALAGTQESGRSYVQIHHKRRHITEIMGEALPKRDFISNASFETGHEATWRFKSTDLHIGLGMRKLWR